MEFDHVVPGRSLVELATEEPDLFAMIEILKLRDLPFLAVLADPLKDRIPPDKGRPAGVVLAHNASLNDGQDIGIISNKRGEGSPRSGRTLSNTIRDITTNHYLTLYAKAREHERIVRSGRVNGQ